MRLHCWAMPTQRHFVSVLMKTYLVDSTKNAIYHVKRFRRSDKFSWDGLRRGNRKEWKITLGKKWNEMAEWLLQVPMNAMMEMEFLLELKIRKVCWKLILHKNKDWNCSVSALCKKICLSRKNDSRLWEHLKAASTSPHQKPLIFHLFTLR
jgi:hypothetical protein